MEKSVLFKLCSDNSKLRILNLLMQGELCGCQLQEILDLHQVTVSKSLSKLREFSILKTKRTSTRIFYYYNEQFEDYNFLMTILKAVRNKDNALKEDVDNFKKIAKNNKEYRCF